MSLITISDLDGGIATLIDDEDEDYIRSRGPWSLYRWGGKLYARRTRPPRRVHPRLESR